VRAQKKKNYIKTCKKGTPGTREGHGAQNQDIWKLNSKGTGEKYYTSISENGRKRRWVKLFLNHKHTKLRRSRTTKSGWYSIKTKKTADQIGKCGKTTGAQSGGGSRTKTDDRRGNEEKKKNLGQRERRK